MGAVNPDRSPELIAVEVPLRELSAAYQAHIGVLVRRIQALGLEDPQGVEDAIMDACIDSPWSRDEALARVVLAVADDLWSALESLGDNWEGSDQTGAWATEWAAGQAMFYDVLNLLLPAGD